jgi:hypothetical protein
MVPTRSKALLLCGWLWCEHSVRGGLVGSTAGPGALVGHLLCKRHFCLFPLAAAPVVGRVVAAAAAAFKLQLWDRALPSGGVRCECGAVQIGASGLVRFARSKFWSKFLKRALTYCCR